mmetsp:Transcript_9277/g.26755  ORF Transcript_9277/g.26755 Transcript_9277/m.26755 type:complete len:253 (+) Transcript_9277:1425-2183(+)
MLMLLGVGRGGGGRHGPIRLVTAPCPTSSSTSALLLLVVPLAVTGRAAVPAPLLLMLLLLLLLPHVSTLWVVPADGHPPVLMGVWVCVRVCVCEPLLGLLLGVLLLRGLCGWAGGGGRARGHVPVEVQGDRVDRTVASNEVRMVRVDVAQLNLYEVADHLVGGLQALPEDAADHLDQPVPQVGVARHLGRLAHLHHLLQLLVYLVDASECRLLEFGDLFLDEYLKGPLRHEQSCLGPRGVSDRRPNLQVCQT